MKVFLAILGFIGGNLLGIAIMAMVKSSSNSQMENPFILATICGIICAIIGYNLPKSNNKKN